MRMKGFDLMHYVVSIKMKLENKSFDDAFEESIDCIKEHLNDFRIDKKEFKKEYKSLRNIK